jgi:hypothetical protein
MPTVILRESVVLERFFEGRFREYQAAPQQQVVFASHQPS